MAIDRAPWNALIDDDESNLVGTVWNKDKIKTVILDPIDALVGSWIAVPFSAANFPNMAGITAGQVTANLYSVNNKTMFWMLKIAGAPASGAASLNLTIPGAGAFVALDCFTPTSYASDAGGIIPAWVSRQGAQTLGVFRTAGGNWTGAVYCYFTAIIALS